jgi:YD repeat-containing protein
MALLPLCAPPSAVAEPAAAATASPTGPRPSATRIPFAISDKVSASVDVGTGNLLVTTNDLVLPGIQHDLELGLDYNSLRRAAGAALPSGSAGAGWAMRVGQDTKLIVNGDNSVLYLAPEGREGLFEPRTATTYAAPPGFKVTMMKTTSGWTVTDHVSNEVSTYDAVGKLTAITDRNSRTATFTYTAGQLSQVVSTRGAAGANTANFTWSGSLTGITQTGADGTRRSVTYTYTDGKLTKITDPTSKTTRFTYDAATGDLVTITNGANRQTAIQYDTAHRVKKVTQESFAGPAMTRFTYYSSRETLVAEPNNAYGNPSDGLQTDYRLDAGKLVTAVVDPLGRMRAKTYTPLGDVATSTDGTGAVTTFGHDPAVNGGESLTSVTSPTGATTTTAYTNPGAAQYLPSGATDAQGNNVALMYDDAGNQLTAGTSAVSYNADGALATSTDPRGNVSGYDSTDHQLTGIRPPTGSSLAPAVLAYDGFGRIHSVRDGRGMRTIYAYDRADRLKTIQYSDTTADVVFTYDGAGNALTRTDSSGTTTIVYDPQNRVWSRTATSGGGTLAYGYDRTGNLISKTDPERRSMIYTYDAANQLTALTMANGQRTEFAYDDSGRRTGIWFNTNPDHTTFAAHTSTAYDKSGRVARTWTSRASNDTTRMYDTTYCYSPYVPGQPCPSEPVSTDSQVLRWSEDNLTSQVSTYGYDSANRLTAVSNYGGHSYAYTYDDAGNRLTAAVDGVTVQTLTYNSGNQVSNPGYTFDAAGNRTASPGNHIATYNAAGQLTSHTGAAGTTTYTWAGGDQHELVSAINGDDVTRYGYGPADQLQSVTRNGEVSYLDTAADDTPLALTTSGAVEYYVLDGQGTPVGLVGSAGAVTAAYTYDPAGQRLTATGVSAARNPLGYDRGMLDDNSGWLAQDGRWQDTATATATTQDPSLRLLQPGAASRYTTVRMVPRT